MKKRLINTDYYTTNEVGSNIAKLFGEIVKDYISNVQEGYDLIDLEYILVAELQLIMAEHRLVLASKKSKEKRNKRE